MIPTDRAEAANIACLAAVVEARSERPIAAGIVNKALRQGLSAPGADSFRAIPGKGADIKLATATCMKWDEE